MHEMVTTGKKGSWGAGAGAIWCVLVCGCGTNAMVDALQFTTIQDGDYLGGPQVSAVDVTAMQTVERTALYLDGLRIAEDEFAPFELQWNARDFLEGSHELRARAELGDGTQLDHAIRVQIDNTPPALGDIPATATVGQPFALEATDNGKVARVEISSGATDEPPVVLTAAPYATPWQWGCGAVSVMVRVVDTAGGETTRATVVSGSDPQDVDCDKHATRMVGGDDCDDHDAGVHPGADEQHDLVDRNCNGVAGLFDGVDLDHDGVPSIASGGTDCDDSNPAIHGGVVAFGDVLLEVGGQPVTWSPGEAVFSRNFDGRELVLNRAGAVARLFPVAYPGFALESIASGANAGSIAAADGGFVAFGRGNQVVVMARGAGPQWAEHAAIDAIGPVGALAYVRGTSGESVVFQTGTEVWLASNATGTWLSEQVVDVGETLAAPPMAEVDFGRGVSAVFRTSHTAWSMIAFPTQERPWASATMFGPSGAEPTAVSFSVVAVARGDGAAIYERYDSSTPVLTLPDRVTAMYEQYPYLFVQSGAGRVQIFNAARSYHPLTQVYGLPAFESAASYNYEFATSGHLYDLNPKSVLPAPETDDDHVDSNCDGFDD